MEPRREQVEASWLVPSSCEVDELVGQKRARVAVWSAFPVERPLAAHLWLRRLVGRNGTKREANREVEVVVHLRSPVRVPAEQIVF